MTSIHFTTSHEKGKQLTYKDRVLFEERCKHHVPITQSAIELHCSRQTLYSEKKRGCEEIIIPPSAAHPSRGDKIIVKPYSADYAQKVYEQHRSHSHKTPYFLKHPEVKEALVEKLKPKKGKKKRSIAVALFELKDEVKELPAVTTVYNAIYRYQLGAQALEWVGRYRKKKNKFEKHEYKKHLGKSIEERPAEIKERNSFGHWEIDLVLGGARKGEVLMTLLERTTGFYIARKCRNKEAKTINKVLNQTMREIGRKNFLSITSDNGSEFSLLYKLRGISAYFCHPYSSWEKGSNERHNRMLREFVPKGTPISGFSKADIANAQNEINSYPRPSKKFQIPAQLFQHLKII